MSHFLMLPHTLRELRDAKASKDDERITDILSDTISGARTIAAPDSHLLPKEEMLRTTEDGPGIIFLPEEEYNAAIALVFCQSDGEKKVGWNTPTLAKKASSPKRTGKTAKKGGRAAALAKKALKRARDGELRRAMRGDSGGGGKKKEEGGKKKKKK